MEFPLSLPRRRAVPEGIRITKVGLWYVLFAVVVAIAATNTGNNALYIVLAVMLATLVVSGVVSRNNVRRLDVDLRPPAEIFANTPFEVGFEVANRSRLFGHWFLILVLSPSSRPQLVPYLKRAGSATGRAKLMLTRRGLHRLHSVHVASLFPFGFFRKGIRYTLDSELLVYPEIFPAAASQLEEESGGGSGASRRPGRGHDLHLLRSFRPGDDPRAIHWKQSARTGNLIFMEREAERRRRISILFDNGVGRLPDAVAEERFERLVSEAATAAVDYLARGFEVELVTRDRVVRFAGGERQRLVILEELALVAPVPVSADPLRAGDPRVPQIRLAMEADEVAV